MKSKITSYCLILLLPLISCNPDYYSTTKFIVENKSNQFIKVEIYNFMTEEEAFVDTSFNLSTGDKYEISYGGKGDESYKYPFGYRTDSAIIRFNSDKIKLFYKDDLQDRNILEINNFIGKKVSEENYQIKYEYTYSITDEDYNNSNLIDK